MKQRSASSLCNAGELLSRPSSAAAPDHVAIVDGTRRVTHAELLRRAESFGALLKARGVGRGDRVVIFLRRSVESVVALFGTWYAGGVAVMANDRLRSQQV